MGHTGFSYSGRSHHGGDLPGRADCLRRALQLRNLFVRGRQRMKDRLVERARQRRQTADLDDLVTGHQRGKSLHPFRRQGVEGHKSGRQALAGFRCQDLSGLRRAFEPLDQMDRRPACFIDRGEVSLDDMRDDIAGVNADPDVKVPDLPAA